MRHPDYKGPWSLSSANEFGRLVNGVGGRIKTPTNTIAFIRKEDIPYAGFNINVKYSLDELIFMHQNSIFGGSIHADRFLEILTCKRFVGIKHHGSLSVHVIFTNIGIYLYC